MNDKQNKKTENEWNTGQPPNEKFVIVELNGKEMEVQAFYGRDGYRPHWKNRKGDCYAVSTFKRWKPISS